MYSTWINLKVQFHQCLGPMQVLVCVGGADVKLQDPTRRQTALHCASLYGHPDIIRSSIHMYMYMHIVRENIQ